MHLTTEHPNYVRKKLIDLKGALYEPTIIAGDSNTPHLVIDRFSRQKISENTVN